MKETMNINYLLNILLKHINHFQQITNNVVHDPVNGTRPSLGRTWLTVPNTRLELKRPLQERGNKVTPSSRQAILVKSSKQVRENFNQAGICVK